MSSVPSNNTVEIPLSSADLMIRQMMPANNDRYNVQRPSARLIPNGLNGFLPPKSLLMAQMSPLQNLAQLQILDLLAKAQMLAQSQQAAALHNAKAAQQSVPEMNKLLSSPSDRSSPNCADQNGDNSSRRRRRAVANLDNTLDGLVAKRAEQMPMKRRYQSETEAIELPDDELETKRMEADPDVCTRMCSVCGYQGKWVSEMIRHKRVHTSDRPFKCKYCNRTSKWKADLIRHVAKTHGIRVVSKYSRSKAMDLGMQQQQQQQQQQKLLTVEDSADFDAFSSSSCESSAKDENNNNNNGKNGAAVDSLNSQERKAQRLLSSMARNKQLVQRQRLQQQQQKQQQQQQQKQEAKAETEQQQLVLNPLRVGNNDAVVGVGTTELGLPTLQRSSDASLALLQLLNILPHLAPQAREDGSTSSLFSGQVASN
uniref:C2H2-type domain-containing protein n=1 Tax=Globodera rostochiensis TaxID=31243 RepID=A0A914HJX0_GLORO